MLDFLEGNTKRFQIKLSGSPGIHDLNRHFDRIWETKLQVDHQQSTFCTKSLPADLVYCSYNGPYAVLIRAHLRGLGDPIFLAKNVPWKVLIAVSKYQVHSCFSVRDIQG